MRFDRRLATLLCLATAACQKPSPPPPAAQPSTVSLPPEPPPSAAPQATPLDLCKRVEAHNKAVTDEAARELRKAIELGHIPREWTQGREPMKTPCFKAPARGSEAPASAWAIKAERIAEGGVKETYWSLVHIARDGSEVAHEKAEGAPFADVCCSPTATTKNFTVFDFDGDGDPEIGFDIEHEGPEGGGSTEHHIYTFRRGRIEPYPTPFAGPLRDVDGDGRPDLVLEHSEDRKLNCGHEDWDEVSAPSLLARSLPDGSFSVTDEVAAAHARKACPARPKKIVARSARGLVDDKATATNVICARAWGMPAAQVVAELERGCAEQTYREDCDDQRKQRPGECRHRATLARWATDAPTVFAPAAGK